MAENSFFWTTSGSPSGHQVASYTQAHWSTAAEIMAACAGFEGVAPGYKNELAVTYVSANHCHANSGGAVVDGKIYINDAPELAITIDSATAGHYRIDRIVALCDWAAFTVTIAVKKNTVEDAAAPALTLTEDWTVSGTHYAILLYQASVTDAGVVTLTDERNFADVGTNGIGASAITLAKMAANSVDSDQYVDGSVDPIHIANRTRTFLVQGGNSTLSFTTQGIIMPDSDDVTVFGFFYVPSDYVSDMTVKAVVVPNASGNVYCQNDLYAGANGENYATHTHGMVLTAIAVSADQNNAIASISVTNVSAGDFIHIAFNRDSTSGTDTVNNSVNFVGWLVEYTADS